MNSNVQTGDIRCSCAVFSIRQSWRSGLVAATICGLSLLLVAETPGQEKYSPDHPDVKEMADRAVATLQISTRNIGQLALASLAIVEHSKRYRQVVPKDDPLVKTTIESIQRMFPPAPSSNNILEQEECYPPAIALILMAETDAPKYKKEIKQILEMFEKRQRPNGAFTYRQQPNSGDTSQTQFVALALMVAKQHGFDFDVEMPKRALEWLCASQQPGGIWVYKLTNNGTPKDAGVPENGTSSPTLSMQASGLGTVYLLADVLQLNQRAKSMANKLAKDTGLPRTVTVYVKPVDDQNAMKNKTGTTGQF